MDPKALIDGIQSGKLTRRQVLNGLGSLGIAAAVMPILPGRAKAAVDVNYFTWSGYDIPELFPSFIEKYGEMPTFSIFGEEEEALQKLRSGFTPDVTHPCSSNVRRWRDAGVLEPIDTSRIENWANIFPVLKHIRGVQLEDETYLVPFDWGNTSIAYRADLVEIEEESYSLLLDERYKGRMSMFDSSETAAAIGGLLADIRKPFSMTDEEIDEAFAIVTKIHENLRFYWTDPTQIAQALASGELVASTAWNETSVQLKQEGYDIKYMNPKEGMLTWVCGLALIKGGPGDEQQKYDVLNAVLDPKVGEFMINEYGYGHSNEKSYELVDQARLDELGVGNPAAMLIRTVFFDEMPNEVREKVNAKFEQVKAGL